MIQLASLSLAQTTHLDVIVVVDVDLLARVFVVNSHTYRHNFEAQEK